MEKQEWLKQRKVGSSDAIVIMGCAPRDWQINTPYKLWNQRINETETETNRAMERGKFYEEEAVQWAEDKLGMLLDRQKSVNHQENDFMTATLDAVSYDGFVTVEVKVSANVRSQLMKGVIPSTYYPQCQHQMEVQKSRTHFLVGYVPGSNGDPGEGAILEVKRDDKYIAEMIKKEKQWWDCLKSYTPPDLTVWDYEEREDELWEKAAFEFLMLEKELEQYDDIKKKRDEFRERLIELANGRNSRGSGVKLTQSFPKGKVNYEVIPELKLVDLDKYRGPAQERWTISRCV
jgi:putative phage-type endonuclease